jgi:hypothetical protein
MSQMTIASQTSERASNTLHWTLTAGAIKTITPERPLTTSSVRSAIFKQTQPLEAMMALARWLHPGQQFWKFNDQNGSEVP